MAEDKTTAIVVGAGPAGSTAAYLLAREGHEVILVERGTAPGCKNMYGGRMYSHALNRIIPEFWTEAPVERCVERELITFLDGERSVSVACRDSEWAGPGCHSFTLLRAEFDAWLAAKAEEAGALLACGIRVDDLVFENGRVVGIRAGEDEMMADVVIAADGVNSVLARKAGLAGPFSARQVATGVKQIIELPAQTINERFQVDDFHGAAQLFVGDCSGGVQGGGFLYTNKNSISLGLVFNVAELSRCRMKPAEALEDFKSSPHIAPLIEGGREAEYSAHLVPEAGLGMMPELFGDGILVAGDAAGFVLNLGYTVRGMDFAVASGEAAARAVMEAKAHNDFSRNGLCRYRELLRESFVLRDLEAYRSAPEILENKRMFNQYPKLVTGLASELFTVDGKPPARLARKIYDRIRASGIGLGQLALDGWKGARGL
ncbi:FAD-dependent oxidoreductase [Syntrophobacter fumaroxidans]|uniref:FAD dependent oxidoreductase n=1 Tax=Syntrophobacter fumaroxidans (strain DSM 10017 / MPOB) TaxID=335543 RepID=A0LQ94_SYNFM|nr:FAD-dependent oxidoreductase [Syntrophobacter fumaroxidans]ABK19596.1 FAD dependent oxidoreductase [Syntrophobacter fumaroxidans MPOB]